jgi:hypothetical protein
MRYGSRSRAAVVAVFLGRAFVVAGAIATQGGMSAVAQPASPTPLSTVTVPPGPTGMTQSPECPLGGPVPGVLWVVFQPGTPPSEQAAAHAAAGATPVPGDDPGQTPSDSPIGVTVTVPVGTEEAALQAYRSRPSVQSAMPVVISPPRCPIPPPSGPVEQVPLFPGCTNVSLTWPDRTPATVIATAIDPAEAFVALWRLDAARGRFLGWSPTPGAPVDFTTVNRLDAVFICMTERGVLVRPGV